MTKQKLCLPVAAILLLVIALYQIFQITDLAVMIFGYKRLPDVGFIIDLCLGLFLCVVLFMKNRGNLLVLTVGLFTVDIVIDIIYFAVRTREKIPFGDILALLSSAILFIIVLFQSDLKIAKNNASAIRSLSRKFFFVPAIIRVPIVFLSNSTLLEGVIKGYEGAIKMFVWLKIPAILYIVIFYSIAHWVIHPYKKEKIVKATVDATTGATGNVVCDEAYCSLGKHIVLCLFTFGIWYMIWIYRTTGFLNKAPNAEQYNPTAKLLLCLFVPFYQIYWFYKQGQRIDGLSRAKGLNNSDMATLCLILGIFIPIVACILMQDRINAICTGNNLN